MKGLFGLGLALSILAEAAGPRLSQERVVLRTVAGDIVLAFYPDSAPQTVKQILSLMRKGVYDGTHFYRVEPNFVVQVATAYDRTVPLTADQQAAIRKLPLEIDPKLKHRPWVLSMARWPDDPNSAETSFSILLADSPHLDGKFTIFGHVERGFEVVEQMLRPTRDMEHRPSVRLTIHKAEVFDAPEKLATTPLSGPLPLTDPNEENRHSGTRRLAAIGILLMIVLLSAALLVAHTRWSRLVPSFNLASILVGVFLLVLLLQPEARQSSWVGVFLFVCLIALFRALGRFEEPQN